MLISSFMFLDWRFPILNLPYQFDTKLEKKNVSATVITGRWITKNSLLIFSHCLGGNQLANNSELDEMKWYTRILRRKGVWHYLTSPLYLLVVLFLSILLLPGIFLAVTWYPWVYYITQQDRILSKSSIFTERFIIMFVHFS